jgi:predicted metalloendopeptidase
MRRGGAGLLSIALILAAGASSAAEATPASPPPGPDAGIDRKLFDTSIRPQDDFYQYVNGGWLARTEIPPDRPAFGAATELYDEVQRQLRALLEAVAAEPTAAPGSDEARIGTLYRSFMDESHLESLGARPLAREIERIEAMRSVRELPALIAHLQQIGVIVPFELSVRLDVRDTTRYVPVLEQDGLGLPDRDYYLREDATTLRLQRRQYRDHMAAALKLLGDQDSDGEAADILALETRLARAQWSKTDVADAAKTYHRIERSQLSTLGAGFNWHGYLEAVGLDDRASYVIAAEPGFLQNFARLASGVPLTTWKRYLRWHLLSDYSQYLSAPFVDAGFGFYGSVLQGIPQNSPRWKRALALIEQCLGQELGRLYVTKYFLPHDRARAEELVRSILEEYRLEIPTLGWMSPGTRQQALLKLSRISIKIGYPYQWRDDSGLDLRAGDLVGDVMRSNAFQFARAIDRLGRPIDRGDWDSTPQSVNAFYNPQMNEIVFPAAILRPPFFDPGADDAVNYGGIGMIIGHEISHAFDEQGSHYDADGKLRDWWTAGDHRRFADRTRPLVDEYGGFMPLRGRRVNGELTLNENIADNVGLEIAYKAYHLSLDGRPALVIDGLSGDQRFYIGFAQAWREKIRDSLAVEMLQSDPHTLSFVRVIGTLLNQTPFYQTFNVGPGDRMYQPPDQRVVVW